MANEDVVAVFRGDVSDLTSKVEQAKTSVKSLGTEVDKANKKIISSAEVSSKKVGQLNFAFAQLTRELPAFTYSAQTGFLALSNNIPMLFDQIKQLKKANIELTASGQSAIPVWKSVVGALFSWQTVLSLSITAVVIYGKEIGNLISKLFSNEKELNKNKYAQEQLNKVMKEANDILVKNNELSQRGGVSNLSNERQTKDLKKETENQLHILEDREVKAVGFIKSTNDYKEYLSIQSQLQDKNNNNVQIALLTYQLERQKDVLGKIFKTKTGFTQEEIDIEENKLKTILDNLNIEEKAKGGSVKKQKEALSAYEKLIKEINNLELKIKDTLVEKGVANDSDLARLRELQNELLTINTVYDIMQNGIAEVEDAVSEVNIQTDKTGVKIKDVKVGVEEVLVSTQNWIEKLRDAEPALFDIANNIGQITANITQEQINGIQASEKAQLDSLDRQLEAKTISEKEYQKRKEKIEKDADAKSIELKRKQAEREKTIATFQAIIKGALAILEVSANPVLLALTSASVATQITAIQTAPLPQFEKGGLIKGKRHREGGVIIEAEGGEFIANRKSSNLYKDELEAINNMKYERLVQKKYILPALQKQRGELRNEILNKFNDNNLLASDRETRNVLRDIHKAIKKENRVNLRFKNM